MNIYEIALELAISLLIVNVAIWFYKRLYPTDLDRLNITNHILDLLDHGDKHGYELMKLLRNEGLSAFKNKEVALYPLLWDMEQKGLIISYTREEKGRLRRYYAIKSQPS